MAEDAAAATEPNAELESLATSVELTLASVLQGIALAILVPKIVELISNGELAKLPYIPASLLLIFMVWVMFIGQAISFITWPFDPLHNLLYFLIVSSEAVLLFFLDKPVQWFLSLVGFGLLLGPEAPLIALGMGLGALAVRRAKRDAPEELVMVMAAAGSFAAISTVFGSPVIGAVILIEAAGLGGARLPVVLLPGLIAAGLGSLVFIGLGAWTGAEHERVDAEPDGSADQHAADRRPLLLGGGAGDRCGRRGVRDRRARAGRGARRGTAHGAADHHRRAARRRARGRL